MRRFVLLFAMLAGMMTPGYAQDGYRMAGPYAIVARDGQYANTKGGSEKDMWQAWQCAKAGEDATALEIINAYAATLQRFDGHDAPLCLIQAFV